MKKTFANTLFLFAVFGLTLYSVFKGKDLAQVVYYTRSASTLYLILGIICVILYIFGESVIIFYLMRVLKQKIPIKRCFLYSFIGFFFSCVTPSASGGQPAQLYYMKKDNVSIPISTLVLMIVTVTYKAVLVVVGILIFLFHPTSVMKYINPVRFWCYLGIVLNILCIAIIFVLIFHPHLAEILVVKMLHLLQKTRLVNRTPKIEKRIRASMERYRNAAGFIWENLHVIFRVFLITLVQRFLLFFITYLTYKAFHLSGTGIVTILLCQAMISVAVDMLPLPGGMGISENLFLSIFKPIFGVSLTLPGMIVSRGISYYSQLIISAIMTVIASFIIGKKAIIKNEKN